MNLRSNSTKKPDRGMGLAMRGPACEIIFPMIAMPFMPTVIEIHSKTTTKAGDPDLASAFGEA